MKRRLEFPNARAAPLGVAEQLREVDPSAEIVYLGAGQWALGSVQPNDYRRRRADRAIQRELEKPADKQRGGVVLLNRLLRQGFRPIAVYTEAQVQSNYVVHDLRFREWQWRNRPEQAFEENLRAVGQDQSVEQKIQTILEMVSAEFPSVHAHTFRGRRSFVGRGLN